MLTHIHIRNFAIVEQLELDLHSGMTVLSGETGVGKSIMLDALGLALGDRADSGVVRHGSERAEISVGFDISRCPAAIDWLQERELNMDGECLIRRTLTKEGRSKGFINGQPLPLQSLRELGEMLVDIHGQHAHQALLRKEMQRATLDEYGQHGKLLEQVATGYRHWLQLQQQLEALRSKKSEREAKLELLRYQVDELTALNLQPDELQQLDQDHQRLANANRLIEASQQALYQLHEADQGALIGQLQSILSELEGLQGADNRLAPTVELLNSAVISLEEANSELRHYQDAVEADPSQLQELEQRLADIHDLARKHHCQAEQLPELLDTLQQELTAIEAADVKYGSLEGEIAKAAQHYTQSAEKLNAARQKAATKLETIVTDNLQKLSMAGSRLKIALTPLANGEFSAHGLERIEFLVSTNAGQPAQPLGKIASGGELSRISLAIQVITSASHGVLTIIFDEVDVGIGGGTAEIVGQMLRQLGGHSQVLCVTHQPQVASQGHQHLQVRKQSTKERTTTTITPLDRAQRIEEIARMLGGVKITEQTRAHAQEMLQHAQDASRKSA